MLRSRKSQGGFSLVELMVVVAIIGVLAAIAVPAVNKYIAKARQSEAKTQLSALYTSEKAFYAEYNAYDSRFGAVGYSPEGQLRFNVGFSSSVAAPAASGYTLPTGAATNFAVLGFCGTAPAVTNGCSLLNGARNAQPGAITAAVVNNAATGSVFTAQARANIMASSAVEDVWQITHEKILTNTVSGIQ